MKRLLAALGMLVVVAGVGFAQNTSQVFGRVTDSSAAVLPGVTVTLLGPALLEPRIAVTSETGTYQFPGLPIGDYTVRFELAGFGTQARQGVQLTSGFSAQVNVELQIAGLQQEVVVTGVSPIVDLRSTTQGASFKSAELEVIPSSRDVFHVLNQAPGIAVDRQNVGGATNGQQTGMLSRGSAGGQGRWFVDGVDQTSLGSGRPFTLDFNAVEEMQLVAGGADVTQQTPGVTVNIITKSGGDTFRGSTWGFITDRALGSNNVTAAQWQQGANAGSPLMSVRDYGGQLGGPIKRGRVWFFGTYGMQRVNLGILDYYQRTADCAPVAANPKAFDFGDVADCLNLNRQKVPVYGAKFGLRPFKGNQVTVGASFGIRIESARESSELRPFETTNQLTYVRAADALPGTDLGVRFWNYGAPPPSWKFADQHAFSDRWLVDASLGHFCYCNVIRPQDEPLSAKSQAMIETTSSNQARSHVSTAIAWRTNNTADLSTTYFLPGWIGGDHSLKAGYRYGRYGQMAQTIINGDAQALFNSPPPQPIFTTPFTARISRNGTTTSMLQQHSVYFQDTYSVDRFTLNLGARWDRQTDVVPARSAPAHAWDGLPTIDGRPFNLLPAIEVPTVSAGIVWSTIAPRLGVTYDLTGKAKHVLKASYATYYDTSNPGFFSNILSPASNASVDLGWTDLNGDKTVQPGEVNLGVIRSVTGFDPANPASTLAVNNRVDPGLSAPRTDEVVVGLGTELRGDIGITANYIWRKYSNFTWRDTIGVTSADYSPVTFTPPPTSCPSGARCETVTYWVPNFTLPSALLLTNRPDYRRTFGGVEIDVRKRSSSRGLMLNASLSYNNAVDHYDSPAAYEDPTNIAQQNESQFAATNTDVGGGGAAAPVPISAKWISRFSGSYRLPWNVNVAATADVRQGYPNLQAITIASRPNRATLVNVYLDPVGDVRLPTFRSMDFHVDRNFTIGGAKLRPTFDVFNLFNANTVLGQRTNQNAANANQVFSLLASRIARIGATLTF